MRAAKRGGPYGADLGSPLLNVKTLNFVVGAASLDGPTHVA